MKISAVFATCMLALTVAATSTRAADAPAKPTARQLELAHRYIQLIHIDTSYGDAMRALGPSMLASMPKGDGHDPALQQKVLEAVNDATADLMITIVKKMEPVMAEVYTEEELSDLVVFYESKTGRALIEKQPLMVTKMGPMMQEIVPQYQASLREKVCAKIDCKALDRK